MKLKHRPRNAKKGDYGRVLIIGGSDDYVGCLALAGLAALRSGCDWVTIAAPAKVAWAVHCLSADLLTTKFDCAFFSTKHIPAVLQLVQKHDVVLIGPGLGLKKETQAFVKKIISKINKPMVIDADALKVIDLKKVTNAVLTPHAKEFEMLLANARLTRNTFQKKLNEIIVLLKGPTDKIYSKTRMKTNKTGNERMAVAGTGDVLAGLVAGFLAQGYSRMDAAYDAARINGAIGDRLKKQKGYSYIASDMVAEIKRIMRQVKQ